MKSLENIFFIFLTFSHIEAFHDDVNIPTTDQIIAWHGYSVEEHEVTTADNYTLGVFRISGAPDNKCLRRRSVILAHGMLCSSTDWIITGPDNALAYLLADNGYDVWLMNFRGNRYSRKHLNHTTKDEAFWNFSWHEMGVYDIPSVVDHVLERGEAERVSLVCHSSGCTALLVTLGERPEYNRKIESAHMMAPISVMNHTRSSMNSVKGVINTLEVGQIIFGRKEVSEKLIETMWGKSCLRENVYPMICSCPIFLITGWNKDVREYAPVLWEAVYHQQGGLSSKTLIHFIQVAKAGRFQKFNYTRGKNIILYEHENPPAYNISNVLVPINIYYSSSDAIVDLRDVEWLASSLPSVVGMHMVSKGINQHIDFLWKKEIRNSIYDKIIEDMNANNNETNSKCSHLLGDNIRTSEKTNNLSLPWGTTMDEYPRKLKKIPAECQEPKINPTEEMRETLNNYGYPMEYHVLTTEDGYVIAVHRIPSRSNHGHRRKPYPVILVHGCLMTSFSWLVMGRKKSLGYLLADAGYDVWLMNLRGNSNSKMHKTLSECSDEFWDFSWHEMGLYDLPAVIDYVLATTKMEKVDVIGYSLGGNVIVVMGSQRPEYNKKVNVLHLIAPSIIMADISPRSKLFAQLPASDTLRHMIVGDAHEISSSTFGRLVSSRVCKYPILYRLCSIFASIVYGFHEEKQNEEQLSVYLKHIPDGTSTKTLVHLGQIALSGHFRWFDMHERNFEVYGQEQPPEYNLSAITAKVRIYYSEIDECVDVNGMLLFAKELPFVIGMHEKKLFRHQDYIFPLDEHVEQYYEIIRNIKSDR